MTATKKLRRTLSTVGVATASIAALAASATAAPAPTPGPRADLPSSGRSAFLLKLAPTPALRTYDGARHRGLAAARTAARTQSGTIQAAQNAAVAKLPARTPVLYRTQNLIAGVAVTSNVANFDALKAIPGVTAVYPIAPKTVSNASAIPLQGAPAAWAAHSNTGADSTIAVIDTGIDYTHANFGGPGTPEAWDTAHDAPASPNALFPSDKVIGGHDFVGDAYQPDDDPTPDEDAYSPTAHPDENPVDCNGHGSHVAGIAAGFGENSDGSTYTGAYDASTPFGSMKIGPGMAPDAKLIAYKVFGCTGSTDYVTAAIDKAMDPNGDHNFSDRADVINLSVGSTFGAIDDGDSIAANAAVDAGVTVAVAAGNDGDVTDVAGSPGTAAKVITVANSQDASSRVDGTDVKIDGGAPTTYGSTRSEAFDWTGSADLTGTVVRAPADNLTGCSAYPANTFHDQIVLVEWDDTAVDAGLECGSVARSGNLAAAGAIGFIFANTHETFAAGITGSAAIPGVLMAKSGGDAIRAALADGHTVTIDGTTANAVTQNVPDDTNKISDSSSRGIHAAGDVKPDVTAVGTSVFSTAMGTGNDGISFTGTSMATPMVAGLAALIHTEHPAWAPLLVKADIMNTADQDLHVNGSATDPGDTYAPVRVGAGRIEADTALDNDVVAYDADDDGTVSVSYGPVQVSAPTTIDRHITVQNTGAGAATYDVSYHPVTTVPGVSYSVSPSAVTVPAGGTASVTLTLNAPDPKLLTKSVDPTIGRTAADGTPRETLAEASGRVLLAPTGAGPTLRVPVYAAPRPVSLMTQSSDVATGGPTTAQTGPLTLTGSDLGSHGANGVGNGDPDDDISSLTAGFELQATSGLAPQCTVSITTRCYRLPEERDADLRDVGITSDYPQVSNPADAKAYFAIATQGPWTTAASTLSLQVDIDINGDDIPDYYLYTTRSGTDDVFVAELADAAGHILDDQPIDNRTGDVDAALYDSDAMILPVQLSKLAGVDLAHPRITYGVEGYSGYTENPIDQIGVDETGRLDEPLTADLFHPAIQVTGAGDNAPVLDDHTGATLTVTRNLTTYAADHGQGLLMLHLHNPVGDTAAGKAQVVSLRGQRVAFTSSDAARAPGDTATLTATGGGSGNPVVFQTVGGPCSVAGTTVTFTGAGTCQLRASQAGNADFDASAPVTQTIAVAKLATATAVTAGATALTAHVASFGTGSLTGTVAFSVAGRAVGTAPVAGGLATLAYKLPAGATRHVVAAYSGDARFVASTGAADRADPSIRATVTSLRAKTKYGWYRGPVTVAFACAPHGSPLVGACPGATSLSRNAAGQSLTRSITAANGGAATAKVSGINIDTRAPSVKITGPHKNRTYRKLPKAHCVGHDTLSKIASCKIKKRTTGHTVKYTATATDRAGNVKTATVKVRTRR